MWFWVRWFWVRKYYVYNPAGPREPLTPAEEAIEQRVKSLGFPYVSTTRLAPGQGLKLHRHHSRNGHWVVSGSLSVNLPGRIESPFQGPGAPIMIPSNLDYYGTTGPDGCVFVEGHTVLSPTTAKRFFERGAILRANPNDPDVFYTEELLPMGLWFRYGCLILVYCAVTTLVFGMSPLWAALLFCSIRLMVSGF